MNLFEISYYVLIGVLGTMALVLFVQPMRKDVRLKGYNVSLKLMSLSFLALALYCTFKWAIPQEIFNRYFLFMSYLQANLIGLGHINLLSPQKVTKKYVICHFLPLILCLMVYVITLTIYPRVRVSNYEMLFDSALWSNPEWLIRCVWLVLYVATTIYYSIVFFRLYRECKCKADNYFSDPTDKSTSIVRTSFVFALIVATTTLFITTSLYPIVSTILNVCILLFYTMMGIYYIKYPTVFFTLDPVIYEKESEQKDNEEESTAEESVIKSTVKNNDEEKISEVSSSEKMRWENFKKYILEDELYLQKGITMEQLARKINVSRNQLSAMINRYERVNFNAFINQFRIRKACEILDNNPEERIIELSERLGYSEQSNFARNFKQYTGKTPKEYVQKD